ncbi:hypothetical protein D3C84_880830 [compost metagenome]
MQGQAMGVRRFHALQIKPLIGSGDTHRVHGFQRYILEALGQAAVVHLLQLGAACVAHQFLCDVRGQSLYFALQ